MKPAMSQPSVLPKRLSTVPAARLLSAPTLAVMYVAKARRGLTEKAFNCLTFIFFFRLSFSQLLTLNQTLYTCIEDECSGILKPFEIWVFYLT